ncbi:MAG: FtsX-like permease family protein [Betaproteobacteria bacterium]|nr:FtsX-like permease family protein [Betaproteobacteria bacterium]
MIGLRFLYRDWRAGELGILVIAIVIAVTSITSVSFFADRVNQALLRDAHQLLGGDVLLIADRPWDGAIEREARARGLAVATSTNFISMARAGDSAELAAVKAVSEGYPLRGRLRIADAPLVGDRETRAIPAAGVAWVDERLVGALGIGAGQSLELGKTGLKIDAIITQEPDRGVSFFNLAPRVLINLVDLPATGLIQTGSRVTFQIYVAGERPAIESFEAWAKTKLDRGQSLQSLANARPEVRATLDRAEQFLGLTALLAVILAAVAIGLGTRRYVARHLDGYAVMRCLGATQARLFRLCMSEFIILALVASLMGCLLGLAAQALIAYWLSELLGASLPGPSLAPMLQGLAAGVLLLVGFAMPPLLALKNVPAPRVIRRDAGAPHAGALVAYGTALVALALLLIWQAGSVKLGLTVLGGFIGALLVFGLVAFVVVRGLAHAAKVLPLSIRFGIANMRRRERASIVQIVALAIGLMAILMLNFTRGDLIDAWRAKTPTGAPNRFVLNIQPDQLQPVREFFTAERMAPPAIYPMVRGRLIAINGNAIDADSLDERGKRLVEREFNLSYLETLPAHNRIVSGRWFDEGDLKAGAASIEEGIAKTLGAKLGDVLTWSVAGEKIVSPITNVRKLDWDSVQVNFFVIATPALLTGSPTSFITSMHVSSADANAMNRLSKAFPNLTIVDMSAILRQALSVVEQVVRAVQMVFLFALGAGVLVLYTALLATQDERAQETAIMRTLGASRAQVQRAQRIEFLAIGLIAGMLAAIGATAIEALLAAQVFQLTHTINLWIWLAGPAGGVLLAGWNAWSGARAATRLPPVVSLREI